MAIFCWWGMNRLGARIKAAADRIGGLETLAPRLTDVSRRTLSDWSNDKTEPRASSIAEICEITGVSVDWLVTGNGEMLGSQPAIAHVAIRDMSLLKEAIELIEQGLAEARRVATPAGKAEMISAAYEILRDGSAASPAQIIRLVKAS